MSYKSLPLKKEVQKVIHLVLHAIALALGIVGIIAAFKFHNESAILNLYSLHSWLGIGIIVLYAIQVNSFLIVNHPCFIDIPFACRTENSNTAVKVNARRLEVASNIGNICRG